MPGNKLNRPEKCLQSCLLQADLQLLSEMENFESKLKGAEINILSLYFIFL